MSKYQTFVFDSYSFDPDSKTATLNYCYDDELCLSETYTFDFDFTDYNDEVLDRALQNLFFVAGISYYKMYLAPVITINSGCIDENLAGFLSETYEKGLGEFFYVNNLDPRQKIIFPTTSLSKLNTLSNEGQGTLIGLGGGKDSLVSVELLRNNAEIATWSIGHRSQLKPLVDTIGLPHYWIERNWDKQMIELNNKDALNGHVPISAILAAAGCVVAVLAGKSDIVVSNENSASEPTLQYQGIEINHQYSKSIEFEKMFQNLLRGHFGETLRYYSLLRPISELRIAELFSRNGFDTYKNVFCSCNRAFQHDQKIMSWCGKCPKCAFVYLILSPFVDRSELERVYGSNLVLDSSLHETFKNLLGIAGEKPLECVGEIQESRYAMLLAYEKYPELQQIYSFEVPQNYEYRQMHAHLMPDEIYELVSAKMNI